MSYSVLVIEDDPMVSMINEQYVLKDSGFSIAGVCRNGNEALEFLKENSADLILLDVYMPVMDGIETLKKIREMKIDSEVIMITAANDTSTIEKTMHLGVMDYLIKPFDYERLSISLQKFRNKMKVLEGADFLDQSELDSIMAGSTGSAGGKGVVQAENRSLLPKGIQEKTLNRIQDYFEKNTTWQSVEMISLSLGISVVTVRNYLNYLVNEKLIEEDINYSTGGRPSMLYKKR